MTSSASVIVKEAAALNRNEDFASKTPKVENGAPFDRLGPPADPLPFPRARFSRGRRTRVTCKLEDSFEVLHDVLVRDVSREFASGGDVREREAYWRIPNKPCVQTTMGHIEICALLVVREEEYISSDDENDFYEADDLVGESACSEVFEWKGTFVSVKVNYLDRMERFRSRYTEDPLTEIAALQLIGHEHPNVMGSRDVLHDGRNLNIVMRYCEGGDLLELLSRRPDESPALPEAKARHLFRQVIEGIRHIHSVGICHRALSPESVTIDEQDCLVINMGKCLRVPYCHPDLPNTFVDVNQGSMRCPIKPQAPSGSLRFMSPEMYRGRESFDSEAVDVWSAATMLFCMLTGQESYERPHRSDPLYLWMTHSLPELFAEWNIDVSAEAVDLLNKMLNNDPAERLTLPEILNHSWFTR